MRFVKFAALLIVLLGLAACGYVEGNYPEPKTKPPVLPDTWSNPEGESIMIWDRAPQWRGFFDVWVDMKKDLPMVEMAASSGDRRAAAILDDAKEIDAEGLTVFHMALFLSKEAELRLTKGCLNIEFSDGTSTQDEGVSFLEMHKKGPRLRSTRSSAQTIEAKYAEPGKRLRVVIAVPAMYQDKKVTAILQR